VSSYTTFTSRHTSEPFGKALLQLRAERGFSYRQLAYMTGLSAGYLSHLEKGKRTVPANEVLARLARVLHVEVDYFKEYRLRQVLWQLDTFPELLASVYADVCVSPPVDASAA
jgi:transcriptional regulator with XRE-family HTH domain